MPDGTTVEAATDALLADGVGDGLPVVPPTADRLERMLAGVPAPDTMLGAVPPLGGTLTLAAAGYCAVLAGCRPPELPVVLAALRACLEPEFNLLGVQTTTGTAAVAVLVHGHAVTGTGFRAGTNALGPGHRVNAAVGRAVALGLAAIGGARPGVTDMATTGWPGRFGFCLPERSDGPFPTLAQRRGIAGSAVTVLAAAGTAEVLPARGGGTVDDVLDPPAGMLAAAVLATGDPAADRAAEQVVVLPPELEHRLAGLGADIGTVRRELAGRADRLLARTAPGARVGPVEPVVCGGAGVKMLHVPGWMGGSRSITRTLAADPAGGGR